MRDLESYLDRSLADAAREQIAGQLRLLRELRGMVNWLPAPGLRQFARRRVGETRQRYSVTLPSTTTAT